MLCAGGGTRLGGVNKMLRDIAGKSVLQRALESFAGCVEIACVVVVVSEATRAHAERCVKDLGIAQRCELVQGGTTRMESVFYALRAIEKNGRCGAREIVAVHDGARCLAGDEILRRSIRSAAEKGSGVAGIPAVDSLCRADDSGRVVKSIERARVWHTQTPQSFRFDWLYDAYCRAMRDGVAATDEAGLVQCAGYPVYMVLGSEDNIKITNRRDLLRAREKMKEAGAMRVGFGEDTHALVQNDRGEKLLLLAGVRVPFEKTLLGHSDADVLAHAVIDALLGALAWGDIGQWFPDTDEIYRGADSMGLLKHVAAAMHEKGAAAVNLDATIVAQQPKLASYILSMRQNLACALGMDIAAVSVKATTSEGLGFEGQGRGITVRAVANVALL